jgi:hypothetical protein
MKFSDEYYQTFILEKGVDQTSDQKGKAVVEFH